MEVTPEIKAIIRSLEERINNVPTLGLHLSAYNGDVDAIEAVLDDDGDGRVHKEVDEFGSTPLWYACVKGHKECTSDLTDVDMDGGAPAFNDMPDVPIPYALALLGHTNGINAYCRTGLGFPLRNDRDKYLWRAALFIAIMEKKNMIARVLITNIVTYPMGSIEDDGCMNPLIAAITAGNSEFIEWLLNINVPVVIGGFHNGAPLSDETDLEIVAVERMIYDTFPDDDDEDDDDLRHDAVGFTTVINGEKVRILWPSILAAALGNLQMADYIAGRERELVMTEFGFFPASNFKKKQCTRL